MQIVVARRHADRLRDGFGQPRGIAHAFEFDHPSAMLEAVAQ
jgi:hypothetical protein